MTGRPSSFTPEVGDLICERIALGDSLRKICVADDMPSDTTVYRWLTAFPEFCQQYARARESQAERYLDEINEIADNATDDVMFLTSDDNDGDGAKAVIKHSAIQRARLQIDTRKWTMSKLAPKKYGDKTTLAGDPENPVQVAGKIEIVHVKPNEDRNT